MAKNEIVKTDLGVTWTDGFCFEISMGIHSPEDVCEANGVSPEEWESIKENELFQKAVANHTKAIKEGGLTLKLKAAVTTEMLLPQLYKIAMDDNTPAASRISAIDKIAQWSGIDNTAEQAPTFALQINMGNEETKVIDHD